MPQTDAIKRRAHIRIPSSLVVKYYDADSVFYGIVTDISDSGMHVYTGTCPSKKNLTMHIPLKDEYLQVPVRVKWTLQTDEFYDSMGVELSKPPKKYLQLVKKFRDSASS